SVQAPAQGRRPRRGQGADQAAVVDDLRQFAVPAQRDAATGQGLTDADVPAGECDPSRGVHDTPDGVGCKDLVRGLRLVPLVQGATAPGCGLRPMRLSVALALT